MRIQNLGLFLSLCLSLQACSSFNPVTLARLSQISPLTADPSALEVVIEFPDGARVIPGTAVLSFTARKRSTGETIEGSYVLAEKGAETRVYSISDDDVSAMRDFQSRARAWKEADSRDTGGSISLDIEPCLIGDGPAPDATIDVSIRFEIDGPLLPLIRNGAIFDVTEASELAELPQCEL